MLSINFTVQAIIEALITMEFVESCELIATTSHCVRARMSFSFYFHSFKEGCPSPILFSRGPPLKTLITT